MRLLKEIRSLTGNYHAKSGMYHYSRNEFKQAVEFLRKALRETDLAPADRRNARYYLTLALMDSAAKLHDEGETEAGIDQLRGAAEVSPDYPDIAYRLGRLLEDQGRDQQAIVEYRRAIQIRGDYVEAWAALGFCLLRAGRPDEAAAVFGKARDLKVERIEKPLRQAQELLKQNETVEATELFYDALVATPELCRAYTEKAIALLKSEAYDRSLAEFDRALALKPKYPDLHNFRGVVLCELERVDEAIEAFRTAAALSPQFLVPRLNLAFALIRAGEYKEAEAELESILAQDPTEPAAAAKLEELRMGRLPEKRRPVSRGIAR